MSEKGLLRPFPGQCDDLIALFKELKRHFKRRSEHGNNMRTDRKDGTIFAGSIQFSLNKVSALHAPFGGNADKYLQKTCSGKEINKHGFIYSRPKMLCGIRSKLRGIIVRWMARRHNYWPTVIVPPTVVQRKPCSNIAHETGYWAVQHECRWRDG